MNKKQLYEKVLKVIKLKLQQEQSNSIVKSKYVNPKDNVAWFWEFKLVDNEVKCFQTMRANPKLKHSTFELNATDSTNLMCFTELFFDEIRDFINRSKNNPKAP